MLQKELRAAVVREALSWQATPWRANARVKGHGCDCSTFLLEVYERCGVIPHFEPPFAPQQWHCHQTRELFKETVERFAHQVDEPKPGDVVLWKYGHTYSHGGIVIAWPTIIHALIRSTVQLTRADQEPLKSLPRLFYSAF